MLRTAAAAARRTAGSDSRTCPSAPGSMRAAIRLRTSGLNRSDNLPTARRRAWAIGAVERRKGEAGLDLVLDRAVGLAGGALLEQRHRRGVERTNHVLDGAETHRRIVVRESEARHGRPQVTPQAVVRLDLGEVVRCRGAGAGQRDRIHERHGRDAVAAGPRNHHLLVLVPDEQTVLEERREHGTRARVPRRNQPFGDRFLVGEARLTQLSQRVPKAVVGRLRDPARGEERARRAAVTEVAAARRAFPQSHGFSPHL